MVCIRNFNQCSLKVFSGFTLVELIVVILITGILSISIAPRFFGVSAYEDRKAADELLTALRHTQQMAMNRGGDIQLVLTATILLYKFLVALLFLYEVPMGVPLM